MAIMLTESQVGTYGGKNYFIVFISVIIVIFTTNASSILPGHFCGFVSACYLSYDMLLLLLITLVLFFILPAELIRLTVVMQLFHLRA